MHCSGNIQSIMPLLQNKNMVVSEEIMAELGSVLIRLFGYNEVSFLELNENRSVNSAMCL